jgi:hypothetical protein
VSGRHGLLIEQLVLEDFPLNPLNNNEYFSVNSKRTQEAEQYIKSLQLDYKNFKEKIHSRREKILERKQELK